MLITPRTYSASQTPDRRATASQPEAAFRFHTLAGWRQTLVDARPAPGMLLAHQTGSVRVGEVIRYEGQSTEGVPQFEPYLKAGGHWDATVKIPTRYGDPHDLSAGRLGPEGDRSVTWVIEIVSQVIFSNNAAVHFELLVGRDAKSVGIFSASGTSGTGMGPVGKLQDHFLPETRGQQALATKGVYSKSITLHVDDTNSLWNSPAFPSRPAEDGRMEAGCTGNSEAQAQDSASVDVTEGRSERPSKQKVHLVVLTHGLHSNLGADMLYLKESIDAAAKKSREHAGEDGMEEEEQIIVRGFSGNAVRTERGIQYLGKRLAKYVLLMTYPDQSYFPLKGSKSNGFPRPFNTRKDQAKTSPEAKSSTDPDHLAEDHDHAYQITSISFIGHSLGGLIQTYAIAYIQKHSPQFFDRIKPVNFVALATPFLGLSNENPMYVKFALDLGLVGRTGQDLGLSWTAPKVRSGWTAILGGRGDAAKDQAQSDPGAKPLLRILPCGPAHEVLHKFRHRTVYSNVVNDGIVPLRTSCLLFLDWRGLDRVEKARRGNGIVGTMAEWGWAELTGANSKSPRIARSGDIILEDEESGFESSGQGLSEGHHSSRRHDAIGVTDSHSPSPTQFLARDPSSSHGSNTVETRPRDGTSENASNGPLSSFLSFFRPKENKHTPSGKHARIYKRSQTVGSFDANGLPVPAIRENSTHGDEDGVYTPPKTTFFESAGDLLMPPLPPSDFILDPASRPRTIFHDRIYHPEDVPSPVPVKRRTLAFGPSQNKSPKPASGPPSQAPSGAGANLNPGESGLRVEEKIARAYHRDLSWRKVLVRLEPDAHNNIIVRRMFTNAYGWPVVKHLVDTHFGHSPTATMHDTLKQSSEMAKSPGIGPTSSGDEVESQSQPRRQSSDVQCPAHPEADQGIPLCPAENEPHEKPTQSRPSSHLEVSRQDSARWTDRQVDEDDGCESGLDETDDAGFRWSPALRP
ncbi:hypothetical protein N7492_010075 [Penicillium capsulatum]|uniref:DUF676 domain-containing protein n=1 Tax=Penicillium capsulatum TaxID=69766 RepID=A0A9W9HNA6_9EURO|nr:hypothetical protein N7492_010075 [Penicillium capsulatum]